MKKTISICFFAVFLLLYTFGLYLLWNPNEEEKTKVQQIAVETETEQEAAESMNIQKAYVYRILEKDGRLVVYGAGSKEVLFETNIKASSLDEAMQERLREGIGFLTESELYDFLESYSS